MSNDRKAYMKAWRARNAEALREYSRDYRARPEVREKSAAAERARYRANPEKARAYRLANRDKILAYDREYQKEYRRRRPELGRNRVQRRLARKRALPDTFSRADWLRVLEDFGFRCAYCFESKPLEQDHVVPLCAPDCPGHVTGNVVPACRSCNARKGGRRRNDVELLGYEGLRQVAALVRMAFPVFPELDPLGGFR